MTWFFAVLIVLADRSGRGGRGRLAEAPCPRSTTTAPTCACRPTDRLTAQDLREVRFTTAIRGYRASEVDALLARLTEQLEADRPPAPEPEPESGPEPTNDPDLH